MPDQWIIDRVQTAYDWIFDRTGLYKGHVIQLCVLVYIGLRSIFYLNGLLWSGLVCLGFVGVGIFWNLRQKARDYTYLNIFANNCARSRATFTMRASALVLLCIPNKEYVWTFLFGLVLCLFFYLSCVKVRDREPPESRSFSFNPV